MDRWNETDYSSTSSLRCISTDCPNILPPLVFGYMEFQSGMSQLAGEQPRLSHYHFVSWYLWGSIWLFCQPPYTWPLSIQPIDIMRGLKRQQASSSSNFVGCLLLALSYFFFLFLLSVLNDLTGPGAEPLAQIKYSIPCHIHGSYCSWCFLAPRALLRIELHVVCSGSLLPFVLAPKASADQCVADLLCQSSPSLVLPP